MNVTDQWMLERMQQMAASMVSSLPQAGQNADQTSKTEKGESFQDMLDKAKDQKVETPKKDGAPQKEEKAEPVQKQESRKVEVIQNADGTETKTVDLTAQEAAMVIAGYAQLYQPAEDGPVMLVTAQDGNGDPVMPSLPALEDSGIHYAYQAVVVDSGEQWTVESTPELVQALEQLLQDTNDPRPADVILSKLEFNKEGAPIENKMEIVIREPKQELELEPQLELEPKLEPEPQLEPEAEAEVEPKAVDHTGQQPEERQEDEDDSLNAGQMAPTPGQPLFKDVKAAPVKVGENFELDTEQPEMDNKLADTIRMAAENGLLQVEIKLSPENLGALTIKLTQSTEGVLQVVLHTANPKTASLLTQHMDGLNAALQNHGQGQEVRVEVQHSEDSQQARQQFQQADPDGRNRQQRQQQRQEKHEQHSGDFIQRLRLGLFELDEI